jgi:SAM-dependent methyltransferase
MLSGDAFIGKAAEYVRFSETKRILEVGPGYGRLLQSCLDQGIPFAQYCGLDLSEENCNFLRERFPMQNVSFVQGDAETASFESKFDILLSSLTFKHLFPSFEAALRNLQPQLAPGAVLCIDLMEGMARTFKRTTYVRRYTRDEILEIVERVGLEHVAFDEVRHDPEYVRLLMVARRAP